jgi:hypothetical protein
MQKCTLDLLQQEITQAHPPLPSMYAPGWARFAFSKKYMASLSARCYTPLFRGDARHSLPEVSLEVEAGMSRIGHVAIDRSSQPPEQVGLEDVVGGYVLGVEEHGVYQVVVEGPENDFQLQVVLPLVGLRQRFLHSHFVFVLRPCCFLHLVLQGLLRGRQSPHGSKI